MNSIENDYGVCFRSPWNGEGTFYFVTFKESYVSQSFESEEIAFQELIKFSSNKLSTSI